MKKHLLLLFLIALCILIVGIFSKFVPYNMDEFLAYHPISCLHYENNKLNTFYSSCAVDSLEVAGVNLPLRSYEYVGSFRSLIYYPLFLVWKSPLSARFFGLLFLIVEAFVLARIFALKYQYVFFGLILFFPYFFIHIVDTGPVAFHLLSIYLIYYFCIRWKESQKGIFPFLLNAIIFLAIWEKPIFFIYGPSLLFLFVYLKPTKKMLVQSIVPGCLLIMMMAILMTGQTSDGSYYFKEVFNHSGLKSIATLINSPIIYSLINPYYATHRIYEVQPISVFGIVYSLFVFISPFIVGRKRKEYIFFYVLFILQIILIVSLAQSFAMHHIILAFPFLILSFLYSIDYVVFKKWLIIFAILNLFFFSTFPFQKVQSNSSQSLVEINTLLNNQRLANEHYYVIIDWGLYYLQALYGPPQQTVLFMHPLVKSNLPDYLKNKKMFFVYEKKTKQYLDFPKMEYKVTTCFEKEWIISLESENKQCTEF